MPAPGHRPPPPAPASHGVILAVLGLVQFMLLLSINLPVVAVPADGAVAHPSLPWVPWGASWLA